jgi:hypothetical protein
MKLEDLSRLLREVEPAALLVEPPLLARIVQRVTGVTWAVWKVPHSHCFCLDRDTLYQHVDPDELRLTADQPIADPAILLERPTADQLTGPREQLLARYWRLLFHATAHRELNHAIAGLSAAALRERFEALGTAAFEEARNVLEQDGLISSAASERDSYAEFVVHYFELKFFNPTLIPVCFPSLPPAAEVEAVIGKDLDAAAVFRRTRLPNASDPSPKTDDQSDESHDFFHKLMRQAKRAAQAGDTVGAAILHTRAARVAPGSQTGFAREVAVLDLNRLVERLQKALELPEADAAAWRRVLPALLDKADQGARPVEAALLYDLQRACLDHEQKIYALDALDWALSGGKTPLKRELAGQRFVRVPEQLRSATRRLTTARLTDADRRIITGLLRNALDSAEGQLRAKFRPILTDALKNAGLQPTSLPERAALEKTVEELLDRISSTGFLAFGDVRDAIARGQMKLPDLGPSERFRGDSLMRLDKALVNSLDGVYRRAEVYTRWLERGTALNFGTETGRFITRNMTVPFGAAFLLAQFLWLMVFERRSHQPDAPPLNFFGGWNASPFFHAAWLALGFFLLLTIQSADVRAVLKSIAKGLYRGARFLFWEIPLRIWGNPLVRRIVASMPVQFVLNVILKPTTLAMAALTIYSPAWEAGWPLRLFLAWLVSVAVVNTWIGRVAEAMVLEIVRGFIEVIRSTPALLSWINDIFRDFVYVLEWVLVRTEDWLRLRGTSGRFSTAVRAVAGLVWMPFAFLIRFYTIVLIEPMINPLKLPLSILFAKFIYPLLLMLPEILKSDPDSLLGYSSPLVNQLADYLSEPGAWLLVMGTLWLLPDACTFLFWEMRENWKLYRANRPTAIKPVAVGEHGETIESLLHWGIHSGTVPKLFSRLRSAERSASETDVWRDARTYRASLRGVEEAVRRFVSRDFTEVLNSTDSAWGGPVLRVGEVVLGTNRIGVELVPESGDAAAWLEWEDRSSWLTAGWDDAGFIPHLTAEQTRVFENALTYLYKRAGVEVVREQVRAELPANAVHFDIGPDGLLVWYDSREAEPLLYDLGDPVNELVPRIPGQRLPTQGPVLNARMLIFDRLTLSWPEWTEVWRGGNARALLANGAWFPRVLPSLKKAPDAVPHPSANGSSAILPVLSIPPMSSAASASSPG